MASTQRPKSSIACWTLPSSNGRSTSGFHLASAAAIAAGSPLRMASLTSRGSRVAMTAASAAAFVADGLPPLFLLRVGYQRHFHPIAAKIAPRGLFGRRAVGHRPIRIQLGLSHRPQHRSSFALDQPAQRLFADLNMGRPPQVCRGFFEARRVLIHAAVHFAHPFAERRFRVIHHGIDRRIASLPRAVCERRAGLERPRCGSRPVVFSGKAAVHRFNIFCRTGYRPGPGTGPGGTERCYNRRFPYLNGARTIELHACRGQI